MFNICMRMLANRELAEDALQEAFATAFTRLKKLKKNEGFAMWLRTIVVNQCINELRRQKVTFIELDIVRKEKTDNEEEELDITSHFENVAHCIEELPIGYRTILTMYLIEGFDHEEIAGILNISESTSKSQYHRAKKKLKEIIKSKGYAKVGETAY